MRSALAGWRKFIVVIAALGCSFALALARKLTPDFVTVVSVTVVAFVGGNAVEHLKTGVKSG